MQFMFCRYGIAVANNHVEPVFPYISDAGSLSPESCVFGQLLNIGAVLGISFLLHIAKQFLAIIFCLYLALLEMFCSASWH